MNKEQIIDEAYETYKSTTLESDMKKSAWELTVQSMSGKKFIISQEEFINKCKTDSEFSEKWGLKIEEQELSRQERSKLLSTEQFYEFGFLSPFTDVMINIYLNQKNIPTKLITITYKDTKIESYE